MRRRSGFTLIEMMIVLAIIAALAAILTPMGTNALNRAKATQYLADLRNISTAVQMYNMDNDELLGDNVTGMGKLEAVYLNSNQLSVQNASYEASMTGASTLTIGIANIPDAVQTQLEISLPTSYATSNASGFTNSYLIDVSM